VWTAFWIVVGVAVIVMAITWHVETTADKEAARLRSEGKGCPK